MNMTVCDYECAQNLSHEVCGVIINRDCEQCATCADSMHVVRHAIVEVNVVNGVLVVHGELLVVMRVVPVCLDCDDAVVRRTLVLIVFHRSHCFHRSHFT